MADEVLALNQRLLDSILGCDWATYAELCDETLTAFEPESRGQLVEGLAFHKFYFDLPPATGPRRATMASPQVRLLGDVAVVTYVRLSQRLDGTTPTTAAVAETRVWHRRGGVWKHVHFHRSPVG
jgi:calcium/calmodulin-dependent protein kinase (CaM kinase) II